MGKAQILQGSAVSRRAIESRTKIEVLIILEGVFTPTWRTDATGVWETKYNYCDALPKRFLATSTLRLETSGVISSYLAIVRASRALSARMYSIQ